MKYLVYEGYGKTRAGARYKKIRAIKLKGLKNPRIVDIKIDKPTKRGIVTIEHKVIIPKTKIPKTTYRRNGIVHRKAYIRKRYSVKKRISVVLGDVINTKSIRITSNPPKKAIYG